MAVIGAALIPGSTLSANPRMQRGAGHSAASADAGRPSASSSIADDVPIGDCRACHTCPAPTKADPCLQSCTRDRANEFADRMASGRRGPSVVILDELENRYLPVPFDHAGHAAMAAMTRGCEVCHHYTPQGVEHPACKTCHATDTGAGDIQKPGLKGAYHRQCMSCHREWSGETACAACHLPKAGPAAPANADAIPSPGDIIGRMHPPIPEPEQEIYETQREGHPDTKVIFRHREHIHAYGFACADCHKEDNCNRCHENGKQHVQQVRTLDEHHRPCSECHDVDTKDRCNRCHFGVNDPAPPPFDHARTGWPLNRYHAERTCRACHEKTPFSARPRECIVCHGSWSKETFAHAVTGQILDDNHASLDCADCHLERRYDQPPACSSCHDEDEGIAFPSKRPGPTVTSIESTPK